MHRFDVLRLPQIFKPAHKNPLYLSFTGSPRLKFMKGDTYIDQPITGFALATLRLVSNGTHALQLKAPQISISRRCTYGITAHTPYGRHHTEDVLIGIWQKIVRTLNS